MARVLRMPGVAANTTEAVLSEWLVDESAEFAAADPIATVETEKAAVDVEADAPGKVLKTLVPPGAQVDVGDPIAVLGEPDEVVEDLEALLTTLGVAVVADPAMPERRDVADPSHSTTFDTGSVPPPAERVETTASPGSRPGPTATGRVFASPLARKIATDAGLAIDQITGTGPRGRILRRDVEAAVASTNSTSEPKVSHPAATPRTTAPSNGGAVAAFTEIPHSRIRLATARRLTESKQQAPHFYLRATIRAEALLALRAEINGEEAGTRVSVNDLIVKAVAAAHHGLPEMNVTWTPEAVRRYDTVDIAVAVATDRGLMTPVIRNVETLSVSAVAESVRDLAARAREGKLKQHELEGGSISVTNLGMFGVEEFAAIINPPHSAILAIGAIRDEPVIEQGSVVGGKVMTLTLAVDHRPVDGALSARWLSALVTLLEHPVRTLV